MCCLLETTAPQYLEEGSCQLISMPFILLIFLPFTLLPPLSLKEMATHSLGKPKDREAWQVTVHEVAKSQT